MLFRSYIVKVLMAEMKSSICVIFAIMIILRRLSLSVVEAAVSRSLSVGDVKGMHAVYFNAPFFAEVISSSYRVVFNLIGRELIFCDHTFYRFPCPTVRAAPFCSVYNC